jgi:hypothetical protein
LAIVAVSADGALLALDTAVSVVAAPVTVVAVAIGPVLIRRFALTATALQLHQPWELHLIHFLASRTPNVPRVRSVHGLQDNPALDSCTRIGNATISRHLHHSASTEVHDTSVGIDSSSAPELCLVRIKFAVHQ